jgi:transcriptional regulator with XRE-family HTH domain
MTNTANQAEHRYLTNEELAGVVKMFREIHHWSQEQLAEIARVSARTVQRIEEGQPSSLDTRRALAGAFGFEDIDGLNKPYAIPTKEQQEAEKARFEKERVSLKAEKLSTGKQLGKLVELGSGLQIVDAVEMSSKAEEVFAHLTDYCTEYADCDELYSATDKLSVYAELDELVATLDAEGVSLVGASREVMLKVQGSDSPWKVTIVYVVAFAKGQEAETLAVPREANFKL